MNITNKETSVSFYTRHKELLVVGGTIAVLAGAGFTWYYYQKKKQQKLSLNSQEDSLTTNLLDVGNTSNTKINRGISGTIKYGSRDSNVKILQRYLNIYKENLGVDGVFGAKTARAAKKHLGKAVFERSDIEGMQKALKSMGK